MSLGRVQVTVNWVADGEEATKLMGAESQRNSTLHTQVLQISEK